MPKRAPARGRARDRPAGAAYVPVDSRQPALRQQSILRNARVRAVVSVQALDFEHDGCMRIDIDTLPIDPQCRACMKSTATRFAYVIYTSADRRTEGRDAEPRGRVQHARRHQRAP